jgi:hypothetical protein
MTNNTLWVHGNAAQIQAPSGVTAISYGGPGLTGTFALDGSAWVHIPLPTPTILSSEQAELVAVHVQLELGDATIDNVVIYDGPNAIFSSHGLSTVYTLPSPKKISYGVGISLHVLLQHGPDDNNPKPQAVVINAAGGEYSY